MKTELFRHWFIRPIRKIAGHFFPSLPQSTAPLPPLPVRRVFFNARQLASILGDPELTPKHFSAAIELDGSLMPKRRLPRRQPMSTEAKATWARAVIAAGDVTRVRVQDLRTALSLH